MTVLTHGHRETVHLPAYSALTVVASAAGSGSIVRLGDNPGEQSQGTTAVAAGQTRIVGPFSTPTRHQVICAAPTLTLGVAPVDFPTAAEVLATIAITTEGDLVVGDATGTPVRLAAGSEGDVLTIVSGVPTWQAPA